MCCYMDKQIKNVKYCKKYACLSFVRRAKLEMMMMVEMIMMMVAVMMIGTNTIHHFEASSDSDFLVPSLSIYLSDILKLFLLSVPYLYVSQQKSFEMLDLLPLLSLLFQLKYLEKEIYNFKNVCKLEAKHLK